MFSIFRGKSYAYGLHLELGGMNVVGIGRSPAGYRVCYSSFFPSGNGNTPRDIILEIGLEELAGSIDCGAPVVAAMPGEYIRVRNFTVPRMPFRDPENSVEWEMRLLTPGQDMVVRALRLGKCRQDGNVMLDILGVAVPIPLAVGFYSRFSKVGIKLAAVEPEFIGLWYLLERTGHYSLQKDRCTAVAHISKAGTCLMVCRKKSIVFCRHIHPEAGGELVGDASSGPYPGTGILGEISSALRDFSSRGQGGDIGIIYLCGAVGDLFSDSKTFTSGSLDYCLLETELGYGETVPPGLAVATGLALRGLTG